MGPRLFPPDPRVAADYRRINGDGKGPSIHHGNGTEVFGQEMGHGYGLDHSRRDGSEEDYRDPWDVMSTDNAYSAPDNQYAARGPGINAWNMRSKNWLDESRVWKAQGSFNQCVDLRPLHRRDIPGWLAAELPPADGAGGHGRYLVEFRAKQAWDAGFPRSAVLVHRFEGNHSYLMMGTNGHADLVDGDSFTPSPGAGVIPRIEVLRINEKDQTATVRLSCYQSFLLQTGTPIDEADAADFAFAVGDYNRDGVPDVYCLKRANTGTGTLEVHVVDGNP